MHNTRSTIWCINISGCSYLSSFIPPLLLIGNRTDISPSLYIDYLEEIVLAVTGSEIDKPRTNLLEGSPLLLIECVRDTRRQNGIDRLRE